MCAEPSEHTTSLGQPKTRVFIVDDDPAVRSAIKLLIQVFGFAAESYGSAEAFLNAYQPDQPGCLILDLHMPKMNGVELQQQLAARGVSIPTVIITATPDDPLVFLAREAGALAVLPKPIRAEELQRSIEQAQSQVK